MVLSGVEFLGGPGPPIGRGKRLMCRRTVVHLAELHELPLGTLADVRAVANMWFGLAG